MAPHLSPAAAPRIRVAPTVAATVCLATGALFGTPQSASAISGFAIDGSAVQAQYPDAATTGRGGTGGPFGTGVASLGDLRAPASVAPHGPVAAARERRAERGIARRALGAIARAPGLPAAESGSIALLLGALAVVGLASVLRWRRGVAQV